MITGNFHANAELNMKSETSILVVEDRSIDFELLRRMLERSVESFVLEWVKTVEEGLAVLGASMFDVVLLDLALPDCQGVDTVDTFTQTGKVPVLVLSGTDNEDIALDCVKHGAHDYLVKGKFGITALCKSIYYAIERFNLQHALRASQEMLQRERESRRIASHELSSSCGSNGASGTEAMRFRHPAIFAEAVSLYGDLLGLAVEQREFKTDNRVPARVKDLAVALGTYRASAKDIVDIHSESLNSSLEAATVDRAAVCSEEARYLLTGLLGHLCTFYQRHCDVVPTQAALPVYPYQSGLPPPKEAR